MSVPSLFRQDRANGRQGGCLQLELLHGCAECEGIERGRCHSATTGDAAYLDMKLVVDTMRCNILVDLFHRLAVFQFRLVPGFVVVPWERAI